MKRSIRLAVLLVLATSTLVPLGQRAGAYSRAYTDGEDVRGPLDLVDVRIDHGRSATTYKFGMAGRVRGRRSNSHPSGTY